MSKLLKSSSITSDRKSKASLTSTKLSASYVSEHGSTFGRCAAKVPRKNDPGLVRTLSIVNSRIIPTIFNPTMQRNGTFPDLTEIEGTKCTRELGKFLNIIDYEFNYVSFWILDVLSKMIKDLQVQNIEHIHQTKFLAWFKFVLRNIAVSASSREEIFYLLQKMFESAVNMINEGKPIPDPMEIEILNDIKISFDHSANAPSLNSSNSLRKSSSFKSRKTLSSSKPLKITQSASSKLSETLSKRSKASSRVSESSTLPEERIKQNMQHFQTIVEILYQIFGNRFVYTMIHMAFSFPVTITPVDMGVMFWDPKQLRPEPVVEQSVKAASPTRARAGSKSRKQSKQKGKKKKSANEDGTEPVVEQPVKAASPTRARVGSKSRKQSKVNGKKKKSVAGDGSDQISLSKETDKKPPQKKETQEKEPPKDKSKKKLSTDIKESIVKKTEGGKESKKNKTKTKEKGVDEKIKSKTKKSLKGAKKRSRAMSDISNLRKRKTISLEEKMRLFDRNITKELEVELEKFETKNQFILPLSEAVDTNYAANIFKALIPQEKKPVKNLEADKAKMEVKDKKKAKKKSADKGKKSPKSNKK